MTLSRSLYTRFDIRLEPIQNQLPLQLAAVRTGCTGNDVAGIGKADQFYCLPKGAECGKELLTLLNRATIVILGLEQEQRR